MCPKESRIANVLRVPKRRVRVRIRLVDDSLVDGDVYTDSERLDGSPGTVIDRFCDSADPFLPVATDSEHVMLPRAGILTAALPRDEMEPPRAVSARRLDARFRMSNGAYVDGAVYSLLPPAQSRLLDFLNRTSDPFLTVFTGDGAVLINRNHVIRVEECLGE